MKKLNNLLNFGINYIYIIVIAFIFFNVFICSQFIEYYAKSDYIFINIFVILILALCFIFKKKIKLNLLDRFNISTKKIYIISAILLILMLIIFYNSYFLTGWDSNHVTQYAYNLVHNNKSLLEGWNNYYYTYYPNNILITILYSSIFKINCLIGIKSYTLNIFSLITIQSILSFLTAIIVYKIVYDFTKSQKYGFISWLLCVLSACISPWIMIPYTDATSLIIPILIVRLFQKYMANHKDIYILIMSILSFVALKLKPQCFIVTIAIVMYSIFNINYKKDRKKLFKKFTYAIVPFVVLMLSINIFPKYILKLNIDKNDSISFNHYIMMGLNNETDGSYYQEDVVNSFSYKTSSERKKYNNKTSINRLKDYGLVGLYKHLSKKTMVIYNDGTFAWNREGTFYRKIINKDNFISKHSRSLYYQNYKFSRYTYIFLHVVWIIILSGLLLSVKKNNNPLLLILKLSFIGVFLFEMLFEARARYLFCVIPLFIILTSISFYQTNHNLRSNSNEK